MSLTYTPEHTAMMNRTARAAGAVGAKAVVPRVLRDLMPEPDETPGLILDYGAGQAMAHAERFRAEGYDVDAYEVGENATPAHVQHLARSAYVFAYASNVLNVQPSLAHIASVIDQLAHAVTGYGTVVVNFPREPRKSNATQRDVFKALEARFVHVRRVRGVSSPTWVASRPRF